MKLRGIVPPLCTPLTPEYEIDEASLRTLVEFQLDAGVDGVFALGSTGEVAYLPDVHRARVLRIVVEQVAGRVPVLAGVIDTSTLRVAAQAEVAAELGCAGIVATAPFYVRTHPAEIECHFRMLARRCALPVYAYDLPGSVHSKLDGELLLRLAEDGALAGVKDSSGQDGALRTLLLERETRGLADFAVFTGSELTADAALAMGADGVVPGLGNVDPHGYTRLWRAARAGQWRQAASEQDRLARLFGMVEAGAEQRMGRGSSAIGAFKAALTARRVLAHSVTAPPQIPLNEAEIERVLGSLRAAGLEED